ncbi:TIGR04222 domain-containing membrane protein, partial [Phytoactinopolyspora endophytica]|uniref:TIGR04222 domain-containing membrane protein n=1 Tax=Phytoactinopolyspora endophytica TaxID=1642495 RepID=UPI0013EDC617
MVVVVAVATGVLFALLAMIYLVTAAKAQRLRTMVHAAHDHRHQVDSDQLDPYELALLTGGKQRLGQVVLAKLYLDGLFRVRRRGRSYLRQARLEATPGSDARSDAVPDNAAVAIATKVVNSRGFKYPVEVMAAATRADAWMTATLDRLRDAGLLLPVKRLRPLERWRSFASGVQAFMVFPLAAAAFFSVMFLAAGSIEAGVPLYVVVPLFLSTPLVFIQTLRLFGVTAEVMLAAAVAAVYLAVPDVPVWVSVAALIYCAAWLGLFSVHRVTRRSLGARTLAGDAVVAAARAKVGERAARRRSDALVLVALYGLSMLRI